MSFAQFPEPENFDFTYDYIYLGDEGFCNGELILGPSFCSHFSWDSPNLSSTNSTLEYYNLYYLQDGASDPYILATTSETSLSMEVAILGEIWVTAVYTNPQGESQPSNVVTNHDLPLAIDDIAMNQSHEVFYDQNSKILNIKNPEFISKIELYNAEGKSIFMWGKVDKKIDFSAIPKGTYFIVVSTTQQKRFKLKIIQ